MVRVAGRALEGGRRVVPGRRNPVTGLETVFGRCWEVVGRERDVPGRGKAAIALSSSKMSAMPCDTGAL